MASFNPNSIDLTAFGITPEEYEQMIAMQKNYEAAAAAKKNQQQNASSVGGGSAASAANESSVSVFNVANAKSNVVENPEEILDKIINEHEKEVNYYTKHRDAAVKFVLPLYRSGKRTAMSPLEESSFIAILHDSKRSVLEILSKTKMAAETKNKVFSMFLKKSNALDDTEFRRVANFVESYEFKQTNSEKDLERRLEGMGDAFGIRERAAIIDVYKASKQYGLSLVA